MSSQTPNWTKIAQSPRFRALLADKTAFIVPVTAFFLAFYFALPLMTSFSKTLNRPAVGSITWAWVFAFAQFVMTWTLASLYTKRAERFDAQVAEIIAAEKE
ncbi:hypothetical protein CCAX7_45980 [Capsulimonas corticalis]|uniref:Uncharacterized protein n=1 Tax=Capsulimonas corticalis TaxID=2219043 RepID=A0A402D595_9BACT|nr:DUF485 domain-containing protein [Capsulimonas corticalis]BDI32547.1 hypothetical protein CCAX7_45980 [Capsulimonas corticalis]